jgi:hypothetical protein
MLLLNCPDDDDDVLLGEIEFLTRNLSVNRHEPARKAKRKKTISHQ